MSWITDAYDEQLLREANAQAARNMIEKSGPLKRGTVPTSYVVVYMSNGNKNLYPEAVRYYTEASGSLFIETLKQIVIIPSGKWDLCDIRKDYKE